MAVHDRDDEGDLVRRVQYTHFIHEVHDPQNGLERALGPSQQEKVRPATGMADGPGFSLSPGCSNNLGEIEGMGCWPSLL